MSFPCMSPEGARAAVARCAFDKVLERAAMGHFNGHDDVAKATRPTAQSALDAVCARAKENAR